MFDLREHGFADIEKDSTHQCLENPFDLLRYVLSDLDIVWPSFTLKTLLVDLPILGNFHFHFVLRQHLFLFYLSFQITSYALQYTYADLGKVLPPPLFGFPMKCCIMLLLDLRKSHLGSVSRHLLSHSSMYLRILRNFHECNRNTMIVV